MTEMSKSIIELQKVAPSNLETPEDQSEKWSMALQAPNCLKFCIVCLQATLYFWDQACKVKCSLISISNIYTYDQTYKLGISMSDTDQNTSADLQNFKG